MISYRTSFQSGQGQQWFSNITSVSVLLKPMYPPGLQKQLDRRLACVWAELTSEPGANILLAYFHYCNRGTYPFSDECKDSDLQNLAELNGDAIEFVKWTRKQVESHSKLDSTPQQYLISAVDSLDVNLRIQKC